MPPPSPVPPPMYVTSEFRKLVIIYGDPVISGETNISEIFRPLAMGHCSTEGEQSKRLSTFDL